MSVSLLAPASTVLCAAGAGSLEPARECHYTTSFGFRGENLERTSDYHLCSVTGLGQTIQPGVFDAVNYQVAFPQSLGSAVVVLSYMFLTDSGASKSVYDFWKRWHDKCYDRERDTPALFNECSGSGSVMMRTPNDKKLLDCSLEGVWPSGVVVDKVDRSSNLPLMFTVTLQVARVIPS